MHPFSSPGKHQKTVKPLTVKGPKYVEVSPAVLNTHLAINLYTYKHCVKSVQMLSFFLVRIFLYSDWILENKDQKKLRIWTVSENLAST